MKVTNNTLSRSMSPSSAAASPACGCWPGCASVAMARLLIESEALGAGQTICSQGIIHGGAKYACRARSAEAAKLVAEMPALWRRCLSGEGDIDLRGGAAGRTSISVGDPLADALGWRVFRQQAAQPTWKKWRSGIGADATIPRHCVTRVSRHGVSSGRADCGCRFGAVAFAEQHHEAIVLVRRAGGAFWRWRDHPAPSGTAHAGDSPILHGVCRRRRATRRCLWAALQLRPLHMVLVARLQSAGAAVRALCRGQRYAALDRDHPLRRRGPAGLVSRRRTGRRGHQARPPGADSRGAAGIGEPCCRGLTGRGWNSPPSP
jgi:hypothetical protein